MPPQCIAIGASAGGLDPVRQVVSRLPADFPVPVLIVMHIPPYQESYLPHILSQAGHLPALQPEDGAQMEPGRIYTAAPDHHLLTDDSHIAVKRGPKENGFRPSIDALFRSAAYTFGPGAIGVVLSGALNDGTSGLWSIKRLGGIAIVQEPEQAVYPSMPRSALEYVEADYRGSADAIGALLVELAYDAGPRQPVPNTGEDAKRMAIETQIAAGITLPEQVILDLGKLSPFTCPECHGTLVQIMEGNMSRFRCHTGHGFSADALLEGLMETVKNLLWQSTRGYQEGSMLLEHLAGHLHDNGDRLAADRFLAKSRDLNRQASELRRIAVDQESLSEEKIARQPPDTSDAPPGGSQPQEP